jgi:hypothetical protein
MVTWGLEWWFSERAEEVWQRSTSGLLGKVPARGLEVTDALEFILRRPAPKSLMGQVADVLTIVAQKDSIDWRRLAANLEQHPLHEERAHLLESLRDPFLVAWGAPSGNHGWIDAPASSIPAATTPTTPFGRLRQDWRNYRLAWGSAYTPGKALIQLPGYLMARWRLAEPWQLAEGIGRWLRWKGQGQG